MLSHNSKPIFFKNAAIDWIKELNPYLAPLESIFASNTSKQLKSILDNDVEWKKKLINHYGYSKEIATLIEERGLCKIVCIRLALLKKNNYSRFLFLKHYVGQNLHHNENPLSFLPLYQNQLLPEQIQQLNFHTMIKYSLIAGGCDTNNLPLLLQISGLFSEENFHKVLFPHAFRTNNKFIIHHFKIFENLAKYKLNSYSTDSVIIDCLAAAIGSRSIENVERICNMGSVLNNKNSIRKHFGESRIMFFSTITLFTFPALELQTRNNFIKFCLRRNKYDLVQLILELFPMRSEYAERKYECRNHVILASTHSVTLDKSLTSKFKSLFSGQSTALVQAKMTHTQEILSNEGFLQSLNNNDVDVVSIYLAQGFNLDEETLTACIDNAIEHSRFTMAKLLINSARVLPPISNPQPLFQHCLEEGDYIFFDKIAKPFAEALNWSPELRENLFDRDNYTAILLMVAKLIDPNGIYKIVLSEQFKQAYEAQLLKRLALDLHLPLPQAQENLQTQRCR